MKQHLYINTKHNFEAHIVLRSNSGKTNEVLALRISVGFNRGAEPNRLNKMNKTIEAIAL